MATASSINVTLNANTAQFQQNMNAAGNAAAAFGGKARAAGAGVGQSLQAGAYAFQDFVSVMENGGKNALGRAFGSISNNIGMITAGFGPWGMLAGTVGGVLAQLVIPRLFQSEEKIDDNVDAMKRLSKASEEAAQKVAQLWDQKRQREADQRQFDKDIFNPDQTVASVGKVMEEMQAKRDELFAAFKSKVDEGQQVFEQLSQDGKTGITTRGAMELGILNVDPSAMKVMGQEKYEFTDAEKLERFRMSAMAPFEAWGGQHLFDMAKADSIFRPALMNADPETIKAIKAQQEEIERAKELVTIVDKQIAQAKEQKSLLGAEEAAAQIEAKNKEVEQEVKRHEDMIASMQASEDEDLAQSVAARIKAQPDYRTNTPSVAFGSVEAYSIIAKETRRIPIDEQAIDKKVEEEKKFREDQKKLLVDIRKAIERQREKKEPVVVNLD